MVHLQLLGTGNAFLPEGRHHSLLIIDGGILIDAPPTALASLRRAKINPALIHTILITHWHGDHVFGFPFLLLERLFMSDREGTHPLEVHTRRGGVGWLQQLSHLAYPGTFESVFDKRINWKTDSPSKLENAPDWIGERFEVEHEPLVHPHGWYLQHSSGTKIMHCGDSGPCEAIEERAGEADVVILEVGLPNHVKNDLHFSPSTAADLIGNHPNTKFILTHLFMPDPNVKSGTKLPPMPKNAVWANDGFELTIPDPN